MSQKRELGAIVFTDIADFTSMMDKDESKALKIRHQQRDSIQSILKDFDGEYIKEIGDGDLMMFQSATDAVHFTLRLQNDISSNDGFSIRAAVHIGDVVREGEDIFGSGVNMASRIHAFASPGSTIISGSVFQEIKNKSEFSITSLGKKSVKGIDSSIEIHEVSLLEEDTSKDVQDDSEYVEKSIMNDLFERRVPQFIGLYFAISWGIIQFVNWLVDRYLLSPHLVDLSLGIAASMLPSMLLLSYFHGRPGKDQWNRIEKIVVPANFIIAIIILFISFYPKDLGAVTEDITITDENGNEFVQTVVKGDFKKNIILWDFKNVSGNENLNWLETSLADIVRLDLQQDLYIVHHTQWAKQKAQSMGVKKDYEMALQDMKKISNDYHSDFFITGDFDFSDDMYEVNIKIYNPDNLKIVDSMTYKNKDCFSLADEISLGIKEGIGISEAYLDNIIDLPVTEIFTSSFEAFENYGLWMKYWNENNLTEAAKYLDKTFEIDETFAYAHFFASVFKVFNNDIQGRIDHLKKADQYSGKLIQKYAFIVKIGLLDTGLEEDGIKRDKIIEMWMDLYPHDRQVYEIAIQFAMMKGDNKKQIELMEMILKINPGEHDMLFRIGNIYSREIGDSKKALEYYKKYEKLYPNASITHSTLAKFYASNENYEEADEHFFKARTFGEKGLVFDMKYINNTGALNGWPLEEYLSEYETLIGKYTTAEDTLQYIRAKRNKLLHYGKVKDAIKVTEQQAELIGRIRGGLFPIFTKGNQLNYLAEIRDDDGANLIFAFMEQSLREPPLDKMHYSFRRLYYSLTEDIENLKVVLEPSIEADFGTGNVRSSYEHSYCYGLIEMHEGNYKYAIEKFQESIDFKATGENKRAFVKIAQCYNQINKKRKAKEYFSRVIDLAGKNHPYINYHYALFLEEEGDIQKAKELIENAYGLYKNADKEMKLAQDIWKKYAEYQALQ